MISIVLHGLHGRPGLIGALGLVISSAAPNVIIWWLGFPVGLQTVLDWWWRRAGGDSWRPIKDALDYVAIYPADGLYEHTYWQSAYQFVYSPLSLVLYRLIEAPPLLDWQSEYSLNRFSWWIVIGGLILTGWLCAQLRRVPDVNPYASKEVLGFAAIGVLSSMAFYPLMYMYSTGQIQTWLDVALILALLLWLRGQRVSVGVLLGLICVVKCNIAPLVIWAMVRREWRFVAGFALAMGVLSIATLLIYGWPVNLEYLKLLSHLSQRGESFVSNQSFNGLLNRAIFNGNNLVWDGTHTQIKLIGWVYYATLVTSVAIILPCLWPRRISTRLESWTDFAIALVSFTLASPIAYEGHFGFLVPIFAMLLLQLAKDDTTPPVVWCALAVSFAFCANRLSVTDVLAPTYANVAQSYVFFGVLLLLGLLYRQRRWFALNRQMTRGLSALAT